MGTWLCDDGNNELEYEAETAEEAAEAYVADGDWGDCDGCVLVYVQEVDEDGEEIGDRDCIEVPLLPDEPQCEDGEEHEWTSPASLGGCDQNPGVWGNGAGFIIHELCAHCGVKRITNTADQDSETGVTYTSVTYEYD